MTLKAQKTAPKKSASTLGQTLGPDESPEEFAASQEKLTVISNMIRNTLVPVQEISAVLNSHLAAKAIDDMLNTVSHPSPPTGKLSHR